MSLIVFRLGFVPRHGLFQSDERVQRSVCSGLIRRLLSGWRFCLFYVENNGGAQCYRNGQGIRRLRLNTSDCGGDEHMVVPYGRPKGANNVFHQSCTPPTTNFLYKQALFSSSKVENWSCLFHCPEALSDLRWSKKAQSLHFKADVTTKTDYRPRFQSNCCLT